MHKRILALITITFLISVAMLGCGQRQIYKSVEGAFQIQFPKGALEEKELVTNTEAGKVKSQMVYLSDKLTEKVLYMVTANAYPSDLEENSRVVLDGVSQGLEISDQVIDEQDVSLQGHPGRRIRYKQHPDWREVEMRVFVAENCLYVLTADSSNKDEDINNVFNSFQILR